GRRLRAEAEAVGILARQPPPPRDPLRGDVLVRQIDVPGTGPGPAHVPADVGAQRHPAHRLHPTGDAGLDRTGRDEAGDQMHGLLRRAALGVEGEAADLVGQPRVQPGGPGDVAGLLAPWVTQPPATWPTPPGSMPARS